jgi:hypothetical protein
MNSLFDDNLLFNEKKHKYSLKNRPDFVFTSTTTMIHKFFPVFNGPRIAQNLIDSVPKYSGMTKEAVMKDWRKSATDGTRVHNELEKYVLNRRTKPKEEKSKQGVQWLKDRVFTQKNWVVYPEAAMFSTDIGISGTADLLIHNTETDEYVIGDWKTNKKITKTSYGNKVGTRQATRHLKDCNYNHYALQFSMYRYILEKYYGLNIKNSFLIHLSKGSYKDYKMPYLKNEIKNMLRDYESIK